MLYSTTPKKWRIGTSANLHTGQKLTINSTSQQNLACSKWNKRCLEAALIHCTSSLQGDCLGPAPGWECVGGKTRNGVSWFSPLWKHTICIYYLYIQCMGKFFIQTDPHFILLVSYIPLYSLYDALIPRFSLARNPIWQLYPVKYSHCYPIKSQWWSNTHEWYPIQGIGLKSNSSFYDYSNQKKDRTV